eukprot:jgi/Psemu1/304737/fgenesh1_kg.167_\
MVYYVIDSTTHRAEGSISPCQSLNKTGFSICATCCSFLADHDQAAPSIGSSDMPPVTESWADGGGSEEGARLLSATFIL